MASKRNSLPIPNSRYTFRARNLNQRRARIRLRYELLETRMMLAAEISGLEPVPPAFVPDTLPPITWFESFQNVERIPLPSLASVDRTLPIDVVGPIALAVGEWIVQLKDTASRSLRSLGTADGLLIDDNNDFAVISGLGAKGLLLVRGQGVSKTDIEASLAHNLNVDSFSLNQMISGQDTTPNDTDFVRGAMPSLTKIGLPTAWNETRGSLSTVVGVLDTGIDLAHRDLYLNIWLNQGEIPANFLDETGNKLTDIDGDGLITFYDLNNVTRAKASPYSVTFGGIDKGPNAEFVHDLNGNGYIDGLDILADPFWADGRDTDGNGEVDDFFGVNFRGDGVHNNPMDGQGHGTHVAGTIGAIGGNGTGVTGINWQTSLMALRILDDNNQGDTGAAIKAVNYATNMRERYTVDNTGRVTQGANVRVLNNSWGQPGGFESSLETTIKDSGDAGILFVAASGNGNFVGQGVDNDRTPFYPASYDSPNVIAVAASSLNDTLASFSNYGARSVDIAAPGVGIRSTELGGGYGTRNGTSMATPHVTGAAALIWAVLPEATVDEVRQAILSTAQPITGLAGKVVTGGRLNLAIAIKADVFAPVATLVSKQDILTAGGTVSEFKIEYSHPIGVDQTTIGNGDILITRQWGFDGNDTATLKSVRVIDGTRRIEATYTITAPGGTWDPLDFGRYTISTVAGQVKSLGGREIRSEELGSFSVRINDNAFIYVDSLNDEFGIKSLRDALKEANAAAPIPKTIILDEGLYRLSIPPVVDPNSTFPIPSSIEGALSNLAAAQWSGEDTGDLDVLGNVAIVGDRNDQTIIDAQGIDRVFKVHPGATLGLNRITVQGGIAPKGQGGGGVLSQGGLFVNESTIRDNRVQSSDPLQSLGGGGIAAWDGNLFIDRSWIDKNQADIGAGVFFRGNANGRISNSTVSNQIGGGLHSISSSSIIVDNSTLSSNVGGQGALFAKLQAIIRPVPPPPAIKTRSDDNRFQVIGGVLNSLLPEDINGFSDVYVYDSSLNRYELVSIASSGAFADGPSDPSNVPLISSDGRFVVFESRASNLVDGDTNLSQDIFIHDRVTGTTTRVSVNDFGSEANADSTLMAISNDATRVLFTSPASNLVDTDTNNQADLFLRDLAAGTTKRIVASDDLFFHFAGAAISGDGSIVAFGSNGSNFVANDTNNADDIFVFNVESGNIDRVSVATDGTQANTPSFLPSVSDDGRYVYFFSDATNLDPTNPVVGTGEYVRDRQLNDTFLRSAPSNAASIFASQITIFDDRVIDQPVVSGRVTLNDSLLAVLNPQPLGDQVTRTNVIGPERFGVTLVTPLTAIANEPPVHELAADNPAIDNGTAVSTFDERGQFRGDKPDIGAVEAVSGSFAASFYYDLNADQRREFNESGVVGVPIRAFVRRGLLVGETATTTDDPTTIDINEQGNFRFPNLKSDIYQFVFRIPEGFQFSQPPIEELRRSAEPVAISSDGNLIAFSSTATNLVVGDRNGKQDIFLLDRSTNIVQRISRGIMGAEPNGDSSQPSISADGRYVAYRSKATNLALYDDEAFDDIFIFDRVNAVTTRISIAFRDPANINDIGGNGNSHSPKLSPGGTFVTFVSPASNFGADDTNGVDDVFVYDIARDRVDVVSDFIIGAQGIVGASDEPTISIDRQTIAFTTKAKDYQHRAAGNIFEDKNAFSDVVYYRPSTITIDPINILGLVSKAMDGGPANGNSHSPAIDVFGNVIAFVSDATNLVAGDDNTSSDIFVDRALGTELDGLVRLMPDQEGGIEADGPSHSPSISGDGRFITFVSNAANWVNGQTNSRDSIYVYSMVDGQVKRLSESITGESPNGNSSSPVFSVDGRFISFNTSATNLFVASTPQAGGTVIVPNPFIEPSASLEIRAGQQVSGLSFGLVPDPGTISGSVFRDDLIANSQFDLGEQALAGLDVYLDFNRNNRRDVNEPRAVTDVNGNYRFDNVPAFRDQAIEVVPPQGFEQVTPEKQATSGFTVFLPAGGNLSGLDFGFRSITTTGQSSDSVIRGRVMRDVNGNGIVDADDLPASGRTVYFDGGTLGVRDFNDPQAVTEADGNYSFTGLASTLTPVRLLLDEDLVQVTPIGNELLGNNSQPIKFPLNDKEKREGNPQSVVTGDFNGDGFADVAVLLSETNKLSIRLNDQQGGFTNQKFDVTLSDFAPANGFAQPVAFVSAQLDGNPKPDFVVAGNFTSNVLVLLNFDFGTKTFASTALLQVGEEPLDIVVGQFAGDASLDLVVLNKGDASKPNDGSVQILTNNGAGIFTAGTAIKTGGSQPVSLAMANFTGSSDLDIAVTHTVPRTTTTTAGGVTMLVGDGKGKLTLDGNYYEVQADPKDSAVGDFNGDQKPDLAVVNLKNNSISILLGGQADGKLRVQTTTLGTVDGAYDLAVADIDNDGDDDVIATKLDKRQVSIFRNIGVDPVTKDVRFEPQENIGLGELTFSERMPFAIANLDNDTSGPSGKGTLDIVAVPQNTDTLYVLPNHLVQGSRRVSVTGASSDIASGIDFLVRSSILPPSFNFKSLPLPIIENAPEQMVTVIGITKGRAVGPALQFTVTSSNTDLITNPTITLVAGTDTATIRYKPLADANGTTVLTVRVVDAGADAVFGNADDGILERSFTVTVLAVDDPVVTSIVFDGAGKTIDLARTPRSVLATIELIDIRGTGSNSLVLDIPTITLTTPNKKLSILADRDDLITFGTGWTIQTPSFINGVFTHIITAPASLTTAQATDGQTVRVELRNDRLLQNPLNPADADRDGKIAALDALRIINEVRRRGSGLFIPPSQDSEISSIYFDVSGDNSLGAQDALKVINAVARMKRAGQSEGEILASPPVTLGALQSTAGAASIAHESETTRHSGMIPATDIGQTFKQPLVKSGATAKSFLKESSSLPQGIRPKLSGDMVDDAFADPLLLNSNRY